MIPTTAYFYTKAVETGASIVADKVKQSVVQMTMLHRQLGKVMRDVYKSNEHVVVEKGGLPVIVMMSMREYEVLIKEKEQKIL